MRNVHRLWESNAIYFLTQVTKNRIHCCQEVEIRKIWHKVWREASDYHQVLCHAFVLLPDHWHALIYCPKEDSLSRFMHSFKRISAKQINEARGRTGGFWQARFYDHAIRDEIDLHKHIDYIHYNPVKHGYVDDPADWKGSSFRQFVSKGYLSEGWGKQEPEIIKDMFRNLE